MLDHQSASTNIAVYRAAAESVAREAGMLLRELWSQPREVSRKALRDFVTDADIAAQSLITRALRRRFPTHGFLAEEDDPNLPPEGPVIWIVDPVDGTTNYSRQVPFFSVSVAAQAATGQMLAGAIYDPVRDELYSAGHGAGATCQSLPIGVSVGSPLADAVVGFDWSRLPGDQERLLALLARAGPRIHSARAIGSAALALAWVAAGRFDGYFNFGCSAWDAAAGSLLIAEAGGSLTAPDGSPWTSRSRGCIAGNPATQEALLSAWRSLS